jgi:signal transduction histidine kinase
VFDHVTIRVSMRERVELVGGRLQIRSTPGEGTTVRATLPAIRR